MHSKLIFVQSKSKGFSFSPLHLDIQFSQNNLLNRLSFLQYMFLAPLLKSDGCSWVFFSWPSGLFHWSLCLFLCQYYGIFATTTL
jgi:hypothetical protein